MEISSVSDYGIIKLLTDDKQLCQDWKNFLCSLGLGNQMEEFEQKYFQYIPVEEITLIMMENWEAASGAKIPQLLEILENLGHTKCKEQIYHFVSEVSNSSKKYTANKKNTWVDAKEINIPKNATGYSYKRLFGEYFDESITNVVIQDPNIQSSAQLNNFDLFLTILLEKCPNLDKIYLITSFDHRKDKAHIRNFQMETLAAFTMKLKHWTQKSINLIITYDQNLYLQDRRIDLDNGWRFRLEKGLDFYYSVDEDTERWTNLDLRRCKQNTIQYINTGKLRV